MSSTEVGIQRGWLRARFHRDTLEEKKLVQEAAWLQKWKNVISQKEQEARFAKLLPKFKTRGAAEIGYYYSIVGVDDTRILFIDRDKETGKGERRAVVIEEDKVYYLETDYRERSVQKDPHFWVQAPSTVEKTIELNNFKHFKSVPAFDSRKDPVRWMGHYPNAEEVLKVVNELKCA